MGKETSREEEEEEEEEVERSDDIHMHTLNQVREFGRFGCLFGQRRKTCC